MLKKKHFHHLTITQFSQIPDSADIYDDVDIRITMDGDPFQADSKVYSAVMPFLETYKPENHDGRRLVCKILFRSMNTYSALQTSNSQASIEDKVEVYPYTKEDMWAHSLFATFRDKKYPPLDREQITYESDKTIHLVLIGFSSWTESLARMAALVCHFPNYIRDHSLRTRITLIDTDIRHKTAAFRNRIKNLLDNSYVRYVDTESCSSTFHAPMYSTSREDFVDVEWEFVEGDETCKDVISKLSYWSDDPGQILTVAICNDSEERNISTISMLPPELEKKGIPVLVKIENDFIFSLINKKTNVISFGKEQEYAAIYKARRMGMAINYVYHRCYSMNCIEYTGSVLSPTEIDFAEAESLWNRLTPAKRFSNIYNALCLSSKMRSLGHKEEDWGTYYSITSKEIELLSIVEHNRWSVDELILGFRPTTDSEQKKIEADIKLKKEFRKNKVHYDLRAYDDLRPDETGKDVAIYDICLTEAIPLIATACSTGEEGCL